MYQNNLEESIQCTYEVYLCSKHWVRVVVGLVVVSA